MLSIAPDCAWSSSSSRRTRSGHPLIAWTCEGGVERLQGFRVYVRCVQTTFLSARFGAPTEQPVESMLWRLDSRDAQWPDKPFAEATRQANPTGQATTRNASNVNDRRSRERTDRGEKIMNGCSECDQGLSCCHKSSNVFEKMSTKRLLLVTMKFSSLLSAAPRVQL